MAGVHNSCYNLYKGGGVMTKVCSRCSSKNRNNARFCNQCSARFPDQSTPGSSGDEFNIYESMVKNDYEAIMKYVKDGSAVNIANIEGYTPLHYAAEHDYRSLAELLISKGANIDAKTIDGWTSVDLARTEGHIEMVELLLHYLALPESKRKRKSRKV